jgi:hypothetical protein
VHLWSKPFKSCGTSITGADLVKIVIIKDSELAAATCQPLSGLKMDVFWVVAPCSLVEVYQRFRGPSCLHHQGDVKTASTSETLVNFYQTKMAVFWVVAPCSLVEVYQRFRGPSCLHHQGDVKTASTSETLVNFYQTKMAVFWVLAPCSLVEVYQRFRGNCCLHHQGDDYTAVQPRIQPSLYSPP